MRTPLPVRQTLKRRHFLRGVAFGTPVVVGLPVLDCFLNDNGDAYAQGQPLPTRFGVFFWGNGRGVEAGRWNPAQVGTAWEPSPQLAPLAPYKDYLNVVSGMRVRLSKSPQGHHKGTVGMMTGADFITQEATNGPYRSTFAGPSIDQIIAQQVGNQTAFKSLELGISTRLIKGEGTTLQFLSHNGPDSGNPQEYDPVALFDRIFKDLPMGEQPMQDPTLIKNATEMKQSVLDSIVADIGALQQRVGSRDKVRLDQHLQNIRDIEKRLGGSMTPTIACTTPMRPGALPKNPAGEPFVERMAGLSDVLALALACDATRVFTLHFSGSAAGPVFHPLGIDRGNHDLSHEGAAAQDEIDRSTIWTMEQLGVLLGKLMSATEGDSNLLKQSAILATSDTADGALHSVTDMPVLVAGSGGGYFKNPGVHHQQQGGNTTEVLLSLVRSMGIQATEFGGGDGHVTQSCSGIEA
jgi:hypothetical protein